MDYSILISDLNKELSSKTAPGPILDEIMFRRLELFSQKFDHNHDLLLIGAILGDIRIDEAKAMGDKSKHVEFALEYAQEIYKGYSVPQKDQEIVNEIIETHHGGEQRFQESKIYKNADNFKFLETRGLLHLFGVFYNDHTIKGLEQTVSFVKNILDEKLRLTDFDEETVEEAKQLHAKNTQILEDLLQL